MAEYYACGAFIRGRSGGGGKKNISVSFADIVRGLISVNIYHSMG